MSAKIKVKASISPVAAAFWANVSYLQDAYDLKCSDIARILKISESTLLNRKNKPKATTLGEVQRIADYFGLKPEQMLTPFRPVAVEPFDPVAEMGGAR